MKSETPAVLRPGATLLLTLGLGLLLPAAGPSQNVPPAPRAVILKAAHLIDGRSDRVRDGVSVLVVGERIRAVGTAAEIAAQAPAGARTIDLGGATLLPGMIDAHTHILLQGDTTAADYDPQLLKESI